MCFMNCVMLRFDTNACSLFLSEILSFFVYKWLSSLLKGGINLIPFAYSSLIFVASGAPQMVPFPSHKAPFPNLQFLSFKMDMRPVCPFLWMSDPQKAFSFRGGALPPGPWGLDQGLCPWSPLGLCSQTSVIGSCSALAMVRAPPLFCPTLHLCSLLFVVIVPMPWSLQDSRHVLQLGEDISASKMSQMQCMRLFRQSSWFHRVFGLHVQQLSIGRGEPHHKSSKQNILTVQWLQFYCVTWVSLKLSADVSTENSLKIDRKVFILLILTRNLNRIMMTEQVCILL